VRDAAHGSLLRSRRQRLHACIAATLEERFPEIAQVQPALLATKGWATSEVDATLSRARVLAEQLDRPEHLVPLMWGQWSFHCVRAEHGLALVLGEQLEQIGEARNDVRAQLVGRRTQGATRFFLGDFVAARAFLEGCVGLADPAQRATGTVGSYAGMLAVLAITLAYLGYIDQARARMDEALSQARRLGHALSLAHVLNQANWLDWLTRSPEVHLDEVRALTTKHGLPFFSGMALAWCGRSLPALGEAQAGLALLKQGLAELRSTGAVMNMPMLFTWLAQTYSLLGQPAEEQHCLAEAARIVEETEERVSEAELLHRVPGDR
jgi:hypothetical protein